MNEMADDLKLDWQKPAGALPEDWIEFHASNDTHFFKVWVSFNGDWCGAVIDQGNGERARIAVEADQEKEAMYQVEQYFFNKAKE